VKRVRDLPRLVARSVAVVWGSARRAFIGTIVLNTFAGALLLVELVVLNVVLGRFVDVGDDAPVGRLVGPVAVFIAGLAIGGVIAVVSSQLSWLAGEQVAREVQGMVGEAASRAALIDFEHPEFHDRLERTMTNILDRPYGVATSLSGLMTSGFGALAALIALVVISPPLALISLLAAVPLVIVSMKVGRLTWSFQVETTENERRREYMLSLLTSKSPAKEIRSFNLGQHFLTTFRGLYDQRIDRQRQLLRDQLRLTVVSRFTNAIVLGAAGGLVLGFVDSGRLTVAQAGTAIAAIALLATRANSVVSALSSVYEHGLFLTETFGFLDEFASAGDHPSTVPVPPFSGVRLDHVSFRYPSGDSDAISDINLEVNPGEVVALVGPNGSGKTTVSKLLAQLFRPSAGHMWWGTADTADLPAAGLREQIAVIFQDFERYELTLGENVSLGRIDAAGDEQRLRAALADADAGGVGSEHGADLDTLLGPRWIGGTDLSIGQWQRLAIARVFYRDAPLLILDEPTASIDAQAEAETFASLRRLAAGRAVVVVSHRFSTVASADRIYVLDGGRIVEHGTHAALLAAEGTYAYLFNLQAASYLGRPTTEM
jgi:ATP-binding cassette, subfamily B, bacterial